MSTFGCPSTSCKGCSQAYLCYCLRVTEDEVRTAVLAEGCTTVGEIRRVTEAGTGCNCCHRRIQAVIDDVHAVRVSHESELAAFAAASRELVVLSEAI